MRSFKVIAMNQKHFNSLICDYKMAGYSIYYLEDNHVELTNDTETVIIEY